MLSHWGVAEPSSLLSSFVDTDGLTEHSERESSDPQWLATIYARVSALLVSFPKLFTLGHVDITFRKIQREAKIKDPFPCLSTYFKILSLYGLEFSWDFPKGFKNESAVAAPNTSLNTVVASVSKDIIVTVF